MRELVTAEVRPHGLAVARMLVALAAFPLVIEWWYALYRVASGEYLAVAMVSWLPSPTPAMVQTLVSIALVAAVLLLVGVLARTSAALTAATAGLALLMDQQTYSNHLVLFVCLAVLLSCSRCAEVITVPRRKGRALVPYWPAFLIKLQISVVYAYTATSKVNEQYLSGAVIGIHQDGLILFPEALLPVVATASIAAEYALAVALWIPRIRALATVIGASLHVGILLVFDYPIALVPFVMLMAAGYVQFWTKPRVPMSLDVGDHFGLSDKAQPRRSAPSTA